MELVREFLRNAVEHLRRRGSNNQYQLRELSAGVVGRRTVRRGHEVLESIHRVMMRAMNDMEPGPGIENVSFSMTELFRRAGLQAADLTVLALTLLVLIGVCVVSATRIRSLTDYFLGGRRFGRAVMLFFAFGSGTSTDQPGSVVAAAWRSGLAGLWWQFLWLPVTPVYWIVAPLLRRVRAITTADFFVVRFGPLTAVLYSVYGMAISVVLMAGMFYSSGKLITALTDNAVGSVAAATRWQVPSIDLRHALEPAGPARPPLAFWRPLGGHGLVLLGLSLIVIGSGFVGGLGAAIMSDVIQGVLTILMTLILLPLVFSRIGGFGMLHASKDLKSSMFDFVASSGATGYPSHEPFTPFYLGMLAVTALAGIIVQPHIMSVCGAARTELASRFGFTFGNLLKRLLAVAWTLIGLACVAWYLGPNSPLLSSGDPADVQLHMQLTDQAQSIPEQQQVQGNPAFDSTDAAFADQLFGRAARALLPTAGAGLLGLLLASVIASVVSHCGTQMTVASGLFTENICRPYLLLDRTPRFYLWVGRISGIFVVGLAVILQTTFVDIIDAMRMMIKTPATIGISMWLGLVWVRWNTPAVWVATVTSTVTWIIVAFFPEEILKTFPSTADLMYLQTANVVVMKDAWQIVWYLSTGLIAGTVCAFLTPPESPDQLDHFYNLLRTPVAPEEIHEQPCRVPPESGHPEPALSIGAFQFPGPTKVGVVGFAVAIVVVITMVFATKWLSLVV